MRRHDLLKVDEAAWDDALGAHPCFTELPSLARDLVVAWARNAWPVIVRRLRPGDSAGHAPAALPLPLSVGKQRLAFVLPVGSVAVRAPVLLREAAAAAPKTWQPVISSLVRLGETFGTPTRVFGALLWEHVTGLRYLGPQSDLDLLWAPPDMETATALVRALRRVEETGPIRLDGEMLLPNGAGVHWRELCQAEDSPNGEVLVKTMAGVKSVPTHGLFRRDGLCA
jgi:phosphoribosyl-dephospho-CoA transferase